MNLGLILLALGALIAHSSAVDIYKICRHFEKDNMLVLDCTSEIIKNITQANKTLDYTDKIQQKNLILSNNNLDSDFLNKINFTGIKILSVSHNKIQELNFNYSSTWSELTKIDFSFNNLSTVKADFFFQLRFIESSNLSNNVISQIIPSASTEVTFLKSLDLSHNNLTNLSNSVFKNFGKLENLSLSFNFIDSIEENAFRDLLVLENLRLENNRLKKIDFLIPVKIYNLFLGNHQYGENKSANSISVFPNNTSLRMLKTLDLSYNNFTSIPASLNSSTNFPELVSVDLIGNPMDNSSLSNNGTGQRPLFILGNKIDNVSPNITKNNQTGSEAINNQTLSIKVQSTLNNSTGTENGTVSTEKPLNTTDAVVSNTTSNQNSNATTPISSSNSTNISNQTSTTGSSNSSTPISNCTLTANSNQTSITGTSNSSMPISNCTLAATSSNQTLTTSTDVKATSVTVYAVVIIAAVIAFIVIVGLINCYRQSVLKRRRQNRRY